MLQLHIDFKNFGGATAEVTCAIGNAGINMEYSKFGVIDLYIIDQSGKIRRDNSRVRGIIVVKDEDGQKTLSVLNSLETTRKDLAMDGIRVFFRILIWVSHEAGALDKQLGKLARRKINLRESSGPELGSTAQKKICKIIIEDTYEKYMEAKKCLGDRIIAEPEFVPAHLYTPLTDTMIA